MKFQSIWGLSFQDESRSWFDRREGQIGDDESSRTRYNPVAGLWSNRAIGEYSTKSGQQKGRKYSYIVRRESKVDGSCNKCPVKQSAEQERTN